MEVHPPSWFLNAPCPCCDQRALEFSTCPTCRLVVLICGEIGQIYAISGRQRGPVIGVFGTKDTCRSCARSPYSEFRSSTSAEIRELGFRWPEDYS